MNVVEFNTTIFQPCLEEITPIIEIARSARADQLLLTIAGQESAWTHRYQLGRRPGTKGPARGFWQFERLGGVAGVIQHRATASRARALIDYCRIPADLRSVWQGLEEDDRLATGFARLLLWTDPRPLPSTQTAGWQCYIRNWRPGKPHLKKWPSVWAAAEEALK